jgi:LysR family hydrogen peroxide-inducible transcriptional activator
MSSYNFTLRQLQYAVAVADTLGFRKAAEKCHVSQPSLSSQLAELETALGAKLFERDRRRVLPTPAGVALVARARQILTLADDLGEAARLLGDPFTGTLKVGVIPTLAPYLLPEVSLALRTAFPRLSFHWAEEKTESLLRDLSLGQLDAGILAVVPGMEEWKTVVIGEDAFVLAAQKSDAIMRGKGPARLSDLDGKTVLLLEDGHCFRDQALAVCERAHADEAEFRATSLATLSQMVAGGAGVTLLPEISLAVENRRGELGIRRFGEPEPRRRIAIAWRKQSPKTKVMSEVARVLRDAYPRPTRR